jgi:hypothetical protein
MYESGGAWLADQGRDPVFLTLLSLANRRFGANGYEQFRFVLSIYFLVFALLVALGRVVEVEAGRLLRPQLVLAIISFSLARFTIQIREGIAATLIVFALAALGRADCTTNRSRQRRCIAASLALLCGAMLTHAGTAVVVAGFLLALMFRGRGELPRRRLQLVWVVISAVGTLFLLGLVGGGLVGQVVTGSYGDRVFEAAVLTFPKIVLWTCYGLVALVIARAVKQLIGARKLTGRVAAVAAVVSGPLMATALVSLYVMLLLQAPTIVVNSYARVVVLLLGTNLILVAAKSSASTTLSACAIFLMIDQMRVILESVYLYYGLTLF